MLEVSERVSCDYQLCMRSCTINGIEIYQVIIASTHVIPSVSDSFEVNTSLVQPFSSILEQVLSSGIELEIRSELYCV